MKVRALAALVALAPMVVAAQQQEDCARVSATEGWQQAPFVAGRMYRGVRVSGAWTASHGVLDPVGAPGHLGGDGPLVEDSAAHGALIFDLSAGTTAQQGSWALFKTMLDEAGAFRMDGAQVRFRINEPDAGLSDNHGALEVCATPAD